MNTIVLDEVRDEIFPSEEIRMLVPNTVNTIPNGKRKKNTRYMSNTNKINFNYSPDLKKKNINRSKSNLIKSKENLTKTESNFKPNKNTGKILESNIIDKKYIQEQSTLGNFNNNSNCNSLLNNSTSISCQDETKCSYTCCLLFRNFETPNNTSQSANNQDVLVSTTFQIIPVNNDINRSNYSFFFRDFLIKFKANLFGLIISAILCASYLFMIYLLRKSFDEFEMNERNQSGNTIKSNVTTINMSCDFCFMLVWSTTNLLSLVYPIFLLSYFLNCNRLKKKKNENQSQKFKFKQIFFNSFKIFDNIMIKADKNASRKFKRDLFFKFFLITIIWIITGYSFLRAIDLLYCSDFIVLFSVNFSFVFIASWIFLHSKFIPLRVIF